MGAIEEVIDLTKAIKSCPCDKDKAMCQKCFRNCAGLALAYLENGDLESASFVFSKSFFRVFFKK
uniref:Uncharacterized protein n=1 Tax=uncultured bacterium contig00046 TaxID=1181532 RepID=A0A806JY54_9BACT|nr:hypothetical protein [uncultured bacterium contig00046]